MDGLMDGWDGMDREIRGKECERDEERESERAN